MDEQLGQILLEGGGGGQMCESYELAMYYMARHTSIDCYEKRGKRGYLFMIGDELPYPAVSGKLVHEVIGDPRHHRGIGVDAMVAELSEKYDVYYILPAGAAYAGHPKVLGTWRGLLGQNVLELDDLDAVCETIALTVGLGEDAIGLDEGLSDLDGLGSKAGASVSKALAKLDRGALVVSEPLDGLDA
jgi:hypothetical protein